MTLSEALNGYMESLSCTSQKLSEVSEVSISTISRYRNEQRIPDRETLHLLSNGIARIAEENGVDLSSDTIFSVLLQSLMDSGICLVDCGVMSARLDSLVKALDISITEISSCCNVDKSFFSRICSGQRKPRDSMWIIRQASRYVVKNYSDQSDMQTVLDLMKRPGDSFENHIDYIEALIAWLSAQDTEEESAVAHVLAAMDEFDIDEFLRAYSFGKVRIPTLPFQLPTSKSYSGISGMEKGIADFLRTTIMSKSRRDLVVYSDHPVDHCMEKADFPKQWMRGVAALLLKGLHINVIHNIDRPIKELMLGVEVWIPLYMSGQISGYYFDDTANNTLHHLLLVSGSAAITGDAVPGHPESGHYTLYKANAEVSRCRERGDMLLGQAKKLIEIYGKSRENEFAKFVSSSLRSHADCKRLLTAPPIYTISDGLLTDILNRNHVSPERAKRIREYVEASRERLEHILKNARMDESIAILGRQEFTNYPVSLSLIYLFEKNDIQYSYEEYLKHIEETKIFAAQRKNYSLTLGREPDFRNMQITVRRGEYAVVSKNKSPAIHLVICHPRMVQIIDGLVMVMKDQGIEA